MQPRSRQAVQQAPTMSPQAPSAFRPGDWRLQQTWQKWLQIATAQKCLRGLLLRRRLLAPAATLVAELRRTVGVLRLSSGSTARQVAGLQNWRVLHCS